jgi:hypothetical protein
VDSSIPLRYFFPVPVYLGMYSHPGLVSKVVSIPRFGFSLCSSLYMRSFCLIPANPLPRLLSPFIASLPNHLHPSLPYDVIPMPHKQYQTAVPSRCPASV